jgi:hypothetical protein
MNEDNIRKTLFEFESSKKRKDGRSPPSEKSLNVYIRNFFKIYEECFAGDEKYVDNAEWISEISTIEKWFADTRKSVPTIRNYITALLIVSIGCNLIPQETYNEWEIIRDNIVDKERKSEKALKSDNQEEQYLDAHIIENHIKSMGKNVKLIAMKTDITNEDRKTVQLWMILRILQTYHMRNEVATFEMYSLREYKKLKANCNLKWTCNNVVFDSKKNQWFISANEYKTSHQYGEKITIVEDKSLAKDLQLFKKINGWGIMFKNSFKNDTPLKPNELSKLLAKWSGQVLPKIEVTIDGVTTEKNRSISTTMLAKIFYSAEQGQAKQDLGKQAKARGHTVKTALQVYVATPDEITELSS